MTGMLQIDRYRTAALLLAACLRLAL